VKQTIIVCQLDAKQKKTKDVVMCRAYQVYYIQSLHSRSLICVCLDQMLFATVNELPGAFCEHSSLGTGGYINREH
jgi:hypothetical protein